MTILTEKVPEELAGTRLDRVLVELFPDYSRSKLQAWIKAGRVRVDNSVRKAKERLEGGEIIRLNAEAEVVVECTAEAIPLDIIFEDEALLVINKPAGMVVHPAVGNWQGTMQNALLHHHASLAAVPRAGIVHRIDKLTSGLLVVAKTLQAHSQLVEQLQARQFTREYQAITQGRMTAGGTVDEPIGRHPVDRKRNAVREQGKVAITHYRVSERFARFTLIQVKLETGRTHQIRVHMEHIRFPLVGDSVYGGRFRLPPQCSGRLEKILRDFNRQALHAAKLGLQHPVTHQYMEWQVSLPDDMQTLLQALREYDQELAER